MSTVTAFKNLEMADSNNTHNSKADAIAEGRRKSQEAREWLLERINVAQRLESFLLKLEFDELLKLESGIAAVKHQKRIEAEEERKAEEARQAAAQKIREIAAQAGLAIEIPGQQKIKAKRTRSRANIDPEKYAVKFQDTEQTHFWSGMGRAPAPFAHAMKKGYKKEELLNPKSGKVLTMAKGPAK